MRNIYKYIDKKYLFPIFLGRIVNSGLVLAQPLILTKGSDRAIASYFGTDAPYANLGKVSFLMEKFSILFYLVCLSILLFIV